MAPIVQPCLHPIFSGAPRRRQLNARVLRQTLIGFAGKNKATPHAPATATDSPPGSTMTSSCTRHMVSPSIACRLNGRASNPKWVVGATKPSITTGRYSRQHETTASTLGSVFTTSRCRVGSVTKRHSPTTKHAATTGRATLRFARRRSEISLQVGNQSTSRSRTPRCRTCAASIRRASPTP